MEHMTVRYYEQVKDYLHPHLNDFINYYRDGDIISLPLYHGCNPLIETEQERKSSTIWAINALFQLINVTGENPRINTEER